MTKGLAVWVVGVIVLAGAAAGADRALPEGVLPGVPSSVEGVASPAEGVAPGGELWENRPYDGRFTLARIRFDARGWADFSWFPGGGAQPPWAHDFPRAEENLMSMVEEISYLRPSFRGGNVFYSDDPELMRFPVAYLVEPGFWEPSEEEVEGLRTYLLKGGFLIVDDFLVQHWANFERQMARVLPGYDYHRLDVDAPIFSSFFTMEDLDFPHPYNRGAQPTYLAIHEENDPERRIKVMVNWQQDIGDYWEFLATGRYPMTDTGEAFKTGINYLIYGMSH